MPLKIASGRLVRIPKLLEFYPKPQMFFIAWAHACNIFSGMILVNKSAYRLNIAGKQSNTTIRANRSAYCSICESVTKTKMASEGLYLTLTLNIGNYLIRTSFYLEHGVRCKQCLRASTDVGINEYVTSTRNSHSHNFLKFSSILAIDSICDDLKCNMRLLI